MCHRANTVLVTSVRDLNKEFPTSEAGVWSTDHTHRSEPVIIKSTRTDLNSHTETARTHAAVMESDVFIDRTDIGPREAGHSDIQTNPNSRGSVNHNSDKSEKEIATSLAYDKMSKIRSPKSALISSQYGVL